MEIATGNSTQEDTSKAVNEAWRQLSDKLNDKPTLLICSASENYSAEALRRCLTELAPDQCKIAGSSFCLGTTNNNGCHSHQGYGLNLIAFADDEGDFGVTLVSPSDSPEEAAIQAINDAAENANRPGELPELVWLCTAPDTEDAVLKGITSVIGHSVPIVGSSSADNKISGNGWQFNSAQLNTNSIVLIAMYPKCQVTLSFHSGYAATDVSGTVTEADGRTIYRIDDQPAAQVYNNWIENVIEVKKSDSKTLQTTSFQPLGREAGRIKNTPYYALLHPEQMVDDDGLRFSSKVNVGEQLTLMSGSTDSLVSRAALVASGALERRDWQDEQLTAALVVYCTGCMLDSVQRMDEVSAGLHDALGLAPFHCMFSFGEQGNFIDGINHHANLMVSVLMFSKK